MRYQKIQLCPTLNHLRGFFAQTGLFDGLAFDGGRRGKAWARDETKTGDGLQDLRVRVLEPDHVVFSDSQVAADLSTFEAEFNIMDKTHRELGITAV